MDDNLKQRMLLFFAIFLTVMFAMQLILPKYFPEMTRPPAQREGDQAPRPGPQAGQQPAAPTAEAPDATPAAAEPQATQEEESGPAVEQITITRSGEETAYNYIAVFDPRGGALRQFVLPDFQVEPDQDEPVVLVDELNAGRLSLALSDPVANDATLREKRYRVVSVPQGAEVAPADLDVPVDPEGRLIFQTTHDGWTIRKIYTFPEDKPYGFGLTLEVTNPGQQARRLNYRLIGPAGILPDDETYLGALEAMTAAMNEPSGTEAEVDRAPPQELATELQSEKLADRRANLSWTGMRNRFFSALLLSEETGRPLEAVRTPFVVDPAYIEAHPLLQPLFASLQVPLAKIENKALSLAARQVPGTVVTVNAETGLDIEANVGPGETLQQSYRFYGGPASDAVLAEFDPRLNHVTSYTVGIFDFLARWLLSLLGWIETLVGNYGVAMILLTILVKTILHPLTRKAIASGHKMQGIAPKVKALQAKYKDDKQKLNQEVMRLYAEEGVNPLGGCLPMLLQLPIFFALYGAFAKGFASRQAVFIPGWIDDLSLPDRLFRLPFDIPFLGWDYFNLLPLIYLVLQIYHMSMQPKSDDPQVRQQQQMMRYMPIIFMFIFYKMPSGLVLYFTVSSLYTIAEHWLIKRNLPAAVPATANASTMHAGDQGGSTAAGVGIGKKGGKKKRK